MSIDLSVDKLQRAWNRLRSDISGGRSFFIPAFLVEIVEHDLPAWLSAISGRLKSGNYTPSPQRNFPVPKPGGLIRPGAILSLDDAVVYSALLMEAMPEIRDHIKQLSPHPDYAYVLNDEDLPDGKWFEHWFKHHQAFTSDSVNLLDDGYEYVVCVDIAGYYEQIELQILRSDLLAANVSAEIVNQLMPLLHRWGPIQKRGLPQGYSSSDVLGKVYLHAIDVALNQKGIKHLRWVDDFRLFVRSKEEGRKALQILISLLGQRGLVIQSSKTKIITAGEAREEFLAVDAMLEPIKSEFEAALRAAGLADAFSLSDAQFQELIADEKGKPSVAVLEEAYQKVFIDKSVPYNKTLFRYLLTRLGAAESHMPMANVLEFLWEHPEETQAILDYVEKVDLIEDLDAAFVARLRDGALIYDYQLYQYLRWRSSVAEEPKAHVLNSVRAILETSVCMEVKEHAYAILGVWGNQADFDEIAAWYSNASSRERVAILSSIRRMEKTKRNGVYGYAQAENPKFATIVSAVKSGALGSQE